MEVVVAIVGLGYVGLPLAHAFARKGLRTIGYDISTARIEGLKKGEDWTHELTQRQLQEVAIEFSTDPSVLKEADVIIVALPTPIDKANKPDIAILKAGTQTVGEHMKKGAIVVFESTVYPGTTRDICGSILEKASGLTCGRDFTLGYSPERVNPGDREHTIEKIVKVVAGQDEQTTDLLMKLYGSVIEAGVHRAQSIEVAEMAKAIENAQRDLNIAFMNEVAMMCNRLEIATKDVLDAAKTKWNFLPFLPGLVGGHCIGVDPYYLVEKARQLNMETQVIAAGRAVNDSMGSYVAQRVADALGNPSGKCVLVLGITFKENVPDTRNSKTGDVITVLKAKGCSVEVDDPQVSPEAFPKEWQRGSLTKSGVYDAILLLVPHREYLDAGESALCRASKDGAIIFDLKTILNPKKLPKRTYLAL
ncbi:nucleotide sugar dehydrogenase [Candidatus Peregrinibacteria bacterium CG10_big_fil_rev_8_21_14_0_10_55_24]|nr:MAG: nucleotide sugar dehydrogenase [Candidatus Peregrinibacteria bacterium CG10_big_fil_rev_8_21_14_0_10_55_24]